MKKGHIALLLVGVLAFSTDHPFVGIMAFVMAILGDD
jgi:hypothetical protein